MRNLLLTIGTAEHQWMRHNLPWLAVLAMLLGFERDEVEIPNRHPRA